MREDFEKLDALYRYTEAQSNLKRHIGIGIGIVYYCQEHIARFEIWHGLHNNNINKLLRQDMKNSSEVHRHTNRHVYNVCV